MTIDRAQWAVDFCNHPKTKFPVEDNNLKSIVCWIASENSGALFNPLDTEEHWEGSTDYNSAGVQNYTSYEAGLDATVATLLNGFYGPIVQALQTNQPMAVTCSLIENSVWGSKPNSALQAAVASNYQSYASVPIAGTTNESEPTNVTPDEPVNPAGSPGGDAPAEVPTEDKIKDATGVEENAPFVAGWPTPTGEGYTAVAADGGVFCKGDAVFHGSLVGEVKLAAPIVDGWAVTNGYFLLGQDGGLFQFGGGVFIGAV